MSTVIAATELRHERAQSFERMKEINDSALEAKRDLSAEEAQEYDRLEKRLDELTPQIERIEKLNGLGGQVDADARAQAQAGGEWSELDADERQIPEWLPAEMRKNLEAAKREGRKAPESFKEFNE